MRGSTITLVLAALFLMAAAATAAEPDRDGDGLSDYQEIHKYLTNPDQADSDGDRIPDGDPNERREYTYSVRAVIRVMRPVAPEFLSDDFQDARVLRETDEFVEIEFVLYPFSTAGKVIEGLPRQTPKFADPLYSAPGVTTNFDPAMKTVLRRELGAAGINPTELTDVQTVRQVSKWLLSTSKHRNMFCTYFTAFQDGKPRVLSGCEEAFESNKGKPEWSVEEQFRNELFGRDMFERKAYGTCTSAAIYLTTVLRAVDIPTRMVLCIPVADPSDPAQMLMVEHGIGHPQVRKAVLDGIKPGRTSFTAHTFNEVFVGGRWHRLNYAVLGDGILHPDYMGLFTRVHTFADLSAAGLAETWGRRYATHGRSEAFPFSNPYRALLIDDLVGPYAESPFGRKSDAVADRADHAKLTITRAYWVSDPDLPAWLPKDALHERAAAGALFLFHVREWFTDQSYNQLKRFMNRTDPQIMLRAQGHPDVPATLNLWYHTSTTNDGREFEVFIKGSDYAKMTPGVPYRLVPANHSEYPWIVAEGVSLTRPK